MRTGNLPVMRFLFGLLLVLVLVPAGGLFAPCCEAALNEACCPLDRDCAAEQGTCPAGATTAAVAPVSFAAAPPPACAPTFANPLVPAAVDPAPPFRTMRGSRRMPLRN